MRIEGQGMTDTPSPGGGSPHEFRITMTLEELLNEARQEARQAAEARAAMLREALEQSVHAWGPVHELDCPEDDTCGCAGKEFNDTVNKALAATDADVTAWLQARERAAAEKAIEVCCFEAMREGHMFLVGKLTAIDVDAVLKGE
jgi:hypothetical protein